MLRVPDGIDLQRSNISWHCPFNVRRGNNFLSLGQRPVSASASTRRPGRTASWLWVGLSLIINYLFKTLPYNIVYVSQDLHCKCNLKLENGVSGCLQRVHLLACVCASLSFANACRKFVNVLWFLISYSLHSNHISVMFLGIYRLIFENKEYPPNI